MISPARLVAHSVLSRVEDGGWASELLLSEARELDSRDAGLASEIVFGSLRRQAQLDWLLAHVSGRSTAKLDVPVRVALRMGAYQLRHLDRVPAHAIVDESVELVKRARKRSASGFVNAILRKMPLAEVEWPHRTVALSMPEWLLSSWDAQWGTAVANGIAEDFLQTPDVFVRNPPESSDSLEFEPAGIPGAFRVLRGDPRGLRIQDVSSQSVVPLLDLRAGDTFLDLCSAPGNKTAQALEAGVQGVAADLHLHRLRTVTGCPRVVLDATAPLPFQAVFDRILVDAPCTGTGTLGRNPEIRWRIQPEDAAELHSRQVRILKNALTLLRPDGVLVYSTCSLEEQENEPVVAEALADSAFAVVRQEHRIPGRDAGDGFYAAVIKSRSSLLLNG